MHNINSPKNLTELKSCINQHKKFMISSFNEPVVYSNYDIYDSDFKEERKLLANEFIDTRAVREFNSILSSVNYSIIGLNNSLLRLMSLESRFELPNLLKECIIKSCYKDQWIMTLYQAIFGINNSPLIKLYLILCNAQLQIIKDNTLQWVLFRDIVDKDGTFTLNYFLPIRIRIDLIPKTHFIIYSSTNNRIFNLPNFPSPIMLGQLILDSRTSVIENVKLLYYYQELLMLLDTSLNKVIGQIFPLPFSTIQQVWNKYLATDIKQLEKRNQEFMLQSVVGLLSPNFL